MKKCLIDKLNSLSRQTFSAGAIVDSKGRERGAVRIRFTDSAIGLNHQGHIVLRDRERDIINFKGDTYQRPKSMVKALEDAGLVALDYYKEPIEKHGEHLSQFSDVMYIRAGRKVFRIIWIIRG